MSADLPGSSCLGCFHVIDSCASENKKYACASHLLYGFCLLASVEVRRLRAPTMIGPALRRIGTVTPAGTRFHRDSAGGTRPAKVSYNREIITKNHVYHSR